MKKITLLALILMTASLSNAQILYRISGNGLKKPSFIVGTHHLTDESFVNQIPGIDKAMKETKQVYGEVLMSNMFNADTLNMMSQAMLLPDKQTIRDIIDPDHFEMLNNLFANLIGITFDSPQIFNAMGNMRPSAIETQITAIAYLTQNPGAFDPNKGVDAFFQNQALAAKKTVGGLESCAFQINTLYLSKPIDEEVKSFYCFLENYEISLKQLNILTEAYRLQDATQIEEAMNIKFGNDCDKLSDDASENLITKRNDNWNTIMPAIMKKAPTLFVVGAGHLFGNNGMISLLKNSGYKVEPVK